MILVTGANGFVGNALCRRLENDGRTVVRAVRHATGTGQVGIGEIGPGTDWSSALGGVDCVIHCAARVHVMNDRENDPLQAFRTVNVAGTLNLAAQAARQGVRRFVLVSSLKVNGETTLPGHPFHADDPADPRDPYGISKHEAECGLRELSRQTGMEAVIVRPPLVYGPGVRANFAAMMRWLYRGIPLPLGAVEDNRRSLVALDNLVDLLTRCIDHPEAAGQTFLVSDGEDLSTAQLLRRLGNALERPARLWRVPPTLLQAGATLLGRQAIAQRLLGSLQVDITKTRELLGWTPPLGIDEGLRRCAKGMKR